MTTLHLDLATLGPKTEELEDTGSDACVSTRATEDAEIRRFAGPDGGRGPTLGRKLELTWEGLRATGVAGCPLCGGRMEKRAAHARCGCCGTRLS